MPKPLRRRRSNVAINVPATASHRGAVEIPAVLDALADRAPEKPTVMVRLLLLARDEVTGEELLVGSFLRRVSMPPDLVSPHATIALEIFGEHRVFTPTGIIWDEPHQVCIVEVEWMIEDAASIVDQ